MLLVSDIQEQLATFKEGLEKRGFKDLQLLDEILNLDQKRRETQSKLDGLKAEMNQISKEIGILFQSGKQDEAQAAKVKTGEIKAEIAKLQEVFDECENSVKTLLYQIPNIPHESVPPGKTEDDNEEVYCQGEAEPNTTGKLPHWDLCKKYDLIDFELGVKITGAGFPVYKGKGAKLQRALIRYFLDKADQGGYTEYIPPLMVNEASGYGTGQLPDKEGQMYHATADDLYLIPTAEVPLTNIYRDSIVKEDELPIKMTGYTPCFRREAGSYGKDVRGLNRLHQFDKVEIVQVVAQEKSYRALDEMVQHVQGLLVDLELPFRILRLCAGDLGFTSKLTFDFEIYSSAQEKWLEVSSVSNFETFQTNRLKLRYKTAEGKNKLAHTLNGSALALPRIVAGFLENHQTEKGIRIPKALVPYTGFEWIS
ncbi:MAG: seryl-tRNA synthetase [Sphingobacteriales bacterium]|jgi:seryl-tRNA synthetase